MGITNQISPNILFAGDVMLGENIYHFGRSFQTKFSSSYDQLISPAIKYELFNDVDAFVYNFEYSLVPDEFDFSTIDSSIYAAPTTSLDVFPTNFLKIVNIANNHFAQHGKKRTKYTIDTLRQHRFIVVGEDNHPTKVIIKNKAFMFWGVSLVNQDDGIFSSSYENLIHDLDIPNQKSADEYWIISIHWGTEYMSYPNENQQILANNLVKSGFDVIHGHHPHVFQPFERINKSVVMYSLGNFLFDQNFSKKTQLAFLPRILFEKDIINLKCSLIKNRNLIPCTIEDDFDTSSVTIKERPLYSRFVKFLITKKYILLSKLEFLPHSTKNNFIVFKYLLKRYRLKISYLFSKQ